MLKYYLEKLDYHKMPKQLTKYLDVPSLQRLKGIGYFCGMDYASKDIYDFSELITRYDHSLTTALLAYKLTGDLETAITGLFHDISTPCFSHVIDYMNKDYYYQESTEELTEEIIKKDKKLLECLKEDDINPETIINFKSNSIIDIERPALCADRLDGIILTSIGWTKNINKQDIDNILENAQAFKNEQGQNEIGFTDSNIAKRVVIINDSINRLCHSKEDNHMMNLLASITKLALGYHYISYQDLMSLSEEEVMNIYSIINWDTFKSLFITFKTIKKEEIEEINLPKIKERVINPIVNGKRIKWVRKYIKDIFFFYLMI